MNTTGLEGTHDLRLPAWGPYTKRYVGISHIADPDRGLRFDLAVFPGFYRRKLDVPNVKWESGYHPWEASTDLTYFSHRHELEWKDAVYADVSFSELRADARLVRCELVNNTRLNQILVLHSLASLDYPSIRPNSYDRLRRASVTLPDSGAWVDGVDYREMNRATPRPADSLVTDGYRRGEVRDHGFVGGSCLGDGFGLEKGDRVVYAVPRAPRRTRIAVLRYRMTFGTLVRFTVDGAEERTVELAGSGEFSTVDLTVPATDETLVLTSRGGGAVEVDGLAFVAREDRDRVDFREEQFDAKPTINVVAGGSGVVLKYPDVERYYGVRWAFPGCRIREFRCADLDSLMKFTVHHHTKDVFVAPGEDHYTNCFLRPIPIDPHSTRVVYGIVCTGTEHHVHDALADFNDDVHAYEHRWASSRSRAYAAPRSGDAGTRYGFSQDRMGATLLTNVVYPVYTKRSYIRHHTPGRWWDSLYTWDSGFVALGLLEIDVDRAVDCLNAYVTEPGDPAAAFIHHGSPVPVQHYVFLELWNRTRSRELLEHFYPRLAQYHAFLAGRLGSSTTRTLKSGLIRTWDYFYNSGGWDDYPPQEHVHRNGLREEVAPVSSTAHCIRTARILKMMAEELGLRDDVAGYEAEIASLSAGLLMHSWDEESGYFGYVRHDADGNPCGILRHESGANYNMGLDGIYPLVAGICTAEQQRLFASYLRDETRLWTPIGISTVDRSAPYFTADGYWNGAVWMPHQWFFWKTMLDCGQAEIAHAIARTALELFSREVDATYNCYEHFIIQSGRGAGWHHFGGLTSPVVAWYNAYHRPGTVTCGFDVWITAREFRQGNTALDLSYRYRGTASEYVIVACMRPDIEYRASVDGREVQARALHRGALEIRIPAGSSGDSRLIVAPEPADPLAPR